MHAYAMQIPNFIYLLCRDAQDSKNPRHKTQAQAQAQDLTPRPKPKTQDFNEL